MWYNNKKAWKKLSKRKVLDMKKVFVSLLLLVMVLGSVFAFTNSSAKWYGLSFFEPSPGANYFAKESDQEIDIFSHFLVNYSFEKNANPVQPSILTSGFTVYSSVMNYFPTTFKYGVIGVDYNLWTKLFGVRLGNSPSEVIFGFGGSAGLSLESIELLVGSSNSAEDFSKVDFYHFNKVYFLNLLGSLRAYVEIPINLYNVPSFMYVFNYNIGVTLYGPFLPNLAAVTVNPNFEKTYSTMSHNILVKVRF